MNQYIHSINSTKKAQAINIMKPNHNNTQYKPGSYSSSFRAKKQTLIKQIPGIINEMTAPSDNQQGTIHERKSRPHQKSISIDLRPFIKKQYIQKNEVDTNFQKNLKADVNLFNNHNPDYKSDLDNPQKRTIKPIVTKTDAENELESNLLDKLNRQGLGSIQNHFMSSDIIEGPVIGRSQHQNHMRHKSAASSKRMLSIDGDYDSFRQGGIDNNKVLKNLEKSIYLSHKFFNDTFPNSTMMQSLTEADKILQNQKKDDLEVSKKLDFTNWENRTEFQTLLLENLEKNRKDKEIILTPKNQDFDEPIAEKNENKRFHQSKIVQTLLNTTKKKANLATRNNAHDKNTRSQFVINNNESAKRLKKMVELGNEAELRKKISLSKKPMTGDPFSHDFVKGSQTMRQNSNQLNSSWKSNNTPKGNNNVVINTNATIFPKSNNYFVGNQQPQPKYSGDKTCHNSNSKLNEIRQKHNDSLSSLKRRNKMGLYTNVQSNKLMCSDSFDRKNDIRSMKISNFDSKIRVNDHNEDSRDHNNSNRCFKIHLNSPVLSPKNLIVGIQMSRNEMNNFNNLSHKQTDFEFGTRFNDNVRNNNRQQLMNYRNKNNFNNQLPKNQTETIHTLTTNNYKLMEGPNEQLEGWKTDFFEEELVNF